MDTNNKDLTKKENTENTKESNQSKAESSKDLSQETSDETVDQTERTQQEQKETLFFFRLLRWTLLHDPLRTLDRANRGGVRAVRC